MPEPIGTTEAAQRLGVDVSTISRWVASGRLKPLFRLPAKTGAMVFAPEEIERVATERQKAQ
jgi:predicted site-specific integrase-resolvase